MNYLKHFNYYYNKQKPLNDIFFEGKEIKLSKKIKCFYNLIDKNKNNKNELKLQKVIILMKMMHFFV